MSPILLVELACGTAHFGAFLAFVCSLALVCKVLLNVEVECVFAGNDCENLVVEGYATAGVLALLVVYCEFHSYFSIKTIEPLLPGMEPLIMMMLCSAITLMTWRFCTVTRLLPVWPAIRMPLNTFAG